MTVRGRAGVAWLAAVSSLAVFLAYRADASPDRPSAERFMKHVGFLASDAMKGRGNGTPELDRAAEYLAAEFTAYGLEPVGNHPSFFQEFEITVDATLGSSNALRINGVTQSDGSDFVTMPLSASGSYEGAVVFAGYGITAPDLRWDDYAGIDVAGKAVLVFSHHPWEGTTSRSSADLFSSFDMKVRNARRHGARAILFVIDPSNHPNEHELIGLATAGLAVQDMGMLAMLVSRRAVEPLFEKTGTSLFAVQQGLDTTMRPASFALTGASIHVTSDVRRTRKTARNVLGAIPGSDPVQRHEWLVIGAHYDHLGLGGTYTSAHPGEIHYGADDNASGTAGLLELARVLEQSRHSLKRSVMFVAFAGEELGMVGSSHFMENAPTPPQSMIAMLNLDMIGRLSGGPVNILGSEIPADLAEWIRHENREIGLTLAFSGGETSGSDWALFSASGIPALSFFTGSHRDYHRPSDTADKVNADGAVRIVSVIGGTAQRIAAAQSTPRLSPSRRRTSASDDREPYFGADPVFDSELNALRFPRVLRGSPAEKAGLKSGDVLVELGDFPVRTLQEFEARLMSLRPGDMIAVAVQRSQTRLRAIVTLEARPTP